MKLKTKTKQMKGMVQMPKQNSDYAMIIELLKESSQRQGTHLTREPENTKLI